jgi:hypothetical protein
MKPLDGAWEHLSKIEEYSYTCGYCGTKTGVNVGYQVGLPTHKIYICGGCKRPSFFEVDRDYNEIYQTPAPAYGDDLQNLTKEIEQLYKQARRCIQAGAYTGCILICRKILMHVAVEEGAKPGESFLSYVTYLQTNNYIPPKGKGWVDYIRERGNEENHEVVLSNLGDATLLIDFTSMLLRNVYDFPARVPKPPTTTPTVS